MVEISAPAALIRDFANTLDLWKHTDALGDPASAREWLRGHDLLDAPLESLLVLREGLRARLSLNNPGSAPDETTSALVAAADRVLAASPVAVRFGDSAQPRQTPVGADAVGQIASAWAVVMASGDWARLKQCPDHTCAEVFWDGTRSRTRRWCSMQVCGNKAKVRAYSARRQAD
jgi:predicted RNA-binding Zn ribbon-like protein